MYSFTNCLLSCNVVYNMLKQICCKLNMLFLGLKYLCVTLTMSRYNLFMHPPPLSFHSITSPDAVGLLPLFSFVQADTGYHSSHHETSMCHPHLDLNHAWQYYISNFKCKKFVFFRFILVSCLGVLSNKIVFFFTKFAFVPKIYLIRNG